MAETQVSDEAQTSEDMKGDCKDSAPVTVLEEKTAEKNDGMSAIGEPNKDSHHTMSKSVAMETETPPAAVDLIAEASRVHSREESPLPAVEKAFAAVNFTRTLYTLAAVLPQDMLVGLLPMNSTCEYMYVHVCSTMLTYCSCQHGVMERE